MLGVCDEEIELAAEKLANKGFVRHNWSFSSTTDPATRQNDEAYKRLQEIIRPDFANFDAHSLRFHYLGKQKFVQQTILIPSSYMHLSTTYPMPLSMDHQLLVLQRNRHSTYIAICTTLM